MNVPVKSWKKLTPEICKIQTISYSGVIFFVHNTSFTLLSGMLLNSTLPNLLSSLAYCEHPQRGKEI